MTLSPRNSLQVVEGLPAVRRAKIVCTLGPGSRSPKMVDRLMQAGMDVVRLNFSHGTLEEHGSAVAAVRAASARYQKPIAILADPEDTSVPAVAISQSRMRSRRVNFRWPWSGRADEALPGCIRHRPVRLWQGRRQPRCRDTSLYFQFYVLLDIELIMSRA